MLYFLQLYNINQCVFILLFPEVDEELQFYNVYLCFLSLNIIKSFN